MTTDDALAYLITILRNPRQDGYQLNHDLKVDVAIKYYLADHHQNPMSSTGPSPHQARLWAPFSAAAWELCRRGWVRPGSRNGGGGDDGFSLTPLGSERLRDPLADDVMLIIPARFTEFLMQHATRWGRGYASRGREAIACYNAMAYPACCAMCGAAAESILIALASQIVGDEAKVVDTYCRANGRSNVTKLIRLDQRKEAERNQFNAYLQLINDWRDESAHGRDISASEGQAFTALLMLMRFSRYASEVFPTPA